MSATELIQIGLLLHTTKGRGTDRCESELWKSNFIKYKRFLALKMIQDKVKRRFNLKL